MNSIYTEMLAVISAKKEGKSIQFRCGAHDTWHTHPAGGVFNFMRYEYRIKPKLKTIYVNEYRYGYSVYTTRALAEKFCQEDEALRVAVPYREVVEESGT